MRFLTVVAPAFAAIFALSACSSFSEVTSGVPPQLAAARGDVADHPVMDEISTVAKNVAFANALIDLYGQRMEKLRDAGYVSSLPLYAAGVASGVLMVHNASKNAIIDIGLAAGAYYGATSSLDFAGRAEVLNGAAESWQCFADAANRVSFLDPEAVPAGVAAKPDLGAIMVHDYELLDRTTRKARAYLSNGQIADKDIRATLASAVDAANAVLPAAGAIAQSAAQVDQTLGKYRRIILRHVATAYAGRRQPFTYQSVMGATSADMDKLIDFRTHAQLAHAKLPIFASGADEAEAIIGEALVGNSRANRTKAFAEFINKVQSGDESQAPRKVRALVYILMEMVDRFSSDTRYLAVASLPVDLAKCVP